VLAPGNWNVPEKQLITIEQIRAADKTNRYHNQKNSLRETALPNGSPPCEAHRLSVIIITKNILSWQRQRPA
jgi:hypothetical protein